MVKRLGSKKNPLLEAATKKHIEPVYKETYDLWQKIYIHRVVRRKTYIDTAIHFKVSEATAWKAVKFFEELSDPQGNFNEAVASLKFLIGEMWSYYDDLGRKITEKIVKSKSAEDGNGNLIKDLYDIETTERSGVPHKLRISLLDKIRATEKDLAVLQGLIVNDMSSQDEIILTLDQVREKRATIESRMIIVQEGELVGGEGLPALTSEK